MRKPVIGVMGGARVSSDVEKIAYELGARIAEEGWILLNGGRDAGVMRASAAGAKSKNGLTIGILPGAFKSDANPFIDIPIVTNMADARNLVNVLSSDVVVACPGSAGTITEVAMALKNGKAVILLQFDLRSMFALFVENGQLEYVDDAKECVERIKIVLRR
ncbi:MAG: TIGR00725 family protein [Actinobacteria bacterium]|nr:TIGR00725 family protein [Actinomycetota bacterium]